MLALGGEIEVKEPMCTRQRKYKNKRSGLGKIQENKGKTIVKIAAEKKNANIQSTSSGSEDLPGSNHSSQSVIGRAAKRKRPTAISDSEEDCDKRKTRTKRCSVKSSREVEDEEEGSDSVDEGSGKDMGKTRKRKLRRAPEPSSNDEDEEEEDFQKKKKTRSSTGRHLQTGGNSDNDKWSKALERLRRKRSGEIVTSDDAGKVYFK